MQQMISDLLRHTATLVGERSRDGSAFNPVSLLIRREIDLSRVIAWMLDPRGTHGENEVFLSEFLRVAGISETNELRLTRVRLEVPRFASQESVGRVDIEVSSPRFLILIENKPSSALGDRQLERYQSSLPTDSLRQTAVVLLPGSGWAENDLSQICQMGVTVLPLGGRLQEWVGRCRDIASATEVKLFLSCFQDYLEERHAGRGSRHMRALVDLMLDTTDTLAAAVAIIDARGALSDEMNRRFHDDVVGRSKLAKLGLVHLLDREKPLFSPSPFGTLRLDIGNPRLDYAIHASDANFRRVRIGLCVREETKALATVYGEEIARVNTALGTSDGSAKSDTWWLWWKDIADLDLDGSHTGSGPALWRWAADQTDNGLVACFVGRGQELKRVLTGE